MKAHAGIQLVAILLFLLCLPSMEVHPASPPTCSAAASLTPDYTYIVGSAHFSDPDGDPEAGSRYRWLVNGAPITDTLVAEGILLNFDGSTTGASGETPTAAQGVAYVSGKWGQALALDTTHGVLKYPRQYNLPLDEGTIEMWVALRADGSDPRYTAKNHYLFFYRDASGDYLLIGQSRDSRILYAGGVVGGQWQSAYGSRAFMGHWKAGEWHHIAFTYSASGNFMRFYVDGILTADTNERRYRPPDPDGTEFSIGGSPWWSNVADYYIDGVRIWGRAASAEEIAARTQRETPPRPNEVWLPTAVLTPSATVVYEFIPRTAGGEEGTPCRSAPVTYPGIPVFDPQPPTTLLPPGSTALTLTVRTLLPTRCAWSAQADRSYGEMTPFGEPTDTLTHTTTVRDLNPDPNFINDVFVRCASHPDFRMRLRYRALSPSNPPFPRTGNLWGWWEWRSKYPLEHLAKVDLWLGADGATPEEIRQLRQLNPHIRILTSINAVENNDIPSPDYYLKDVNGNLIEVWPGSYRLNLTKPEVAEYQAHYAYRSWLNSGMQADGVFFDNVMLTQSWLRYDIYGNPVRIDANEDGVEDDPAWLDAAWKAGVLHEIRTFRRLMPYAIVSAHSVDIHEPGVGELFDGISLGFVTADVIEGERSFGEVWDLYQTWMREARQPPVVMFESSPIDQIAYGYDYSPWRHIPTSTLEFARTYYPWMRFGLALTLLHDGYFAHEFGDTWHGNDWWYDELDFPLGYPLGPAYRVDVGFDPGPNRIVNGGFESPIADPWRFWANAGAGCLAAVSRDGTTAAEGQYSARIVVTATSGTDWHVDFNQNNRSLEKDAVYDLTFWAKADRPRTLALAASKNAPPWTNYGLWRRVTLGPTWQLYTVTFQATATVTDARIQFFAGAVTGTVWLDGIQLRLHPPDVFRRDYT
ncbi:MAG: carbohydrate binding domain-containing protein, partial [Anaerolineae bacterium]|nr:carbohydrate binding domain-containing protein [Anaerolineae bacterium]